MKHYLLSGIATAIAACLAVILALLFIAGYLALSFEREAALTVVAIVVGMVLTVGWYGRLGFISQMRRNRLTSRCCARCGYDLRASTERCPECSRKVRPRLRREKQNGV